MAFRCRFLLLPMLATAATVPEGTYSVHQGFIPQGSDIIVKVMSVTQAKEECVLDPNCEGFTFEGSAEDMEAQRRINLKSKWKLQPDATSSWTSFHLQRSQSASEPQAVSEPKAEHAEQPEHAEKAERVTHAEHSEKNERVQTTWEPPSDQGTLAEQEIEVSNKRDKVIEVEAVTTEEPAATEDAHETTRAPKKAVSPNQWMASDATSPKKSHAGSHKEASKFVPVKATTEEPEHQHRLQHAHNAKNSSAFSFPDKMFGYPSALWIMWLLVGLAAAAMVYSCIVAVARMSRRRSVNFTQAKDLERQDPSTAARLMADKYAQLEVQSPMADTRSCNRSCSGGAPLRGGKERSCTKQDCVVS